MIEVQSYLRILSQKVNCTHQSRCFGRCGVGSPGRWRRLFPDEGGRRRKTQVLRLRAEGRCLEHGSWSGAHHGLNAARLEAATSSVNTWLVGCRKWVATGGTEWSKP